MLSIKFLFFFIPLLSVILILVNLLLAPHMPYKEKKTPFECGYHSFLLQNRTQFTVSFFVFAILFLLFDLEIVLIYPLSVSIFSNGIYGITFAIVFIAILTVGFVLELGKGALKIDSAQYTPDPHRNLQLLQSRSCNNPLNDLNMQQFVTKETYTSCKSKPMPDINIGINTNCKHKFLVDVAAVDNNNPKGIDTGCKNKLAVDATIPNDSNPEEINNFSGSDLLKVFKDFNERLNNLPSPKLSSCSYTDIDNNTFDLINKGFVYKYHLFEFLLDGINNYLGLIFPIAVYFIFTGPITKGTDKIFEILKQQRLFLIWLSLRLHHWILYLQSIFSIRATICIETIIQFIKDIVANLHWTGDYHLFAVLLESISRMIDKLKGAKQNITANPFIKKLGVLGKNFTKFFISVKGILSSIRGFLPPNLSSAAFTQLNIGEQLARLIWSEGEIVDFVAAHMPEVARRLSSTTLAALHRFDWTQAVVMSVMNEIIQLAQDSTIPREVLNNILSMTSRWLIYGMAHIILGAMGRDMARIDYGNIIYIQEIISQINPESNDIGNIARIVERVAIRLRLLKQLINSIRTLIGVIERWGLNNADLPVGLPGEDWGDIIHDLYTLLATICISYNNLLASLEEAIDGRLDMPDI